MLREILDAGQLSLYGPVWVYFDNSEIILGSSSAVLLGTIPWRPQEMLSAGRGEREASLSRHRRAGSVPSHGDQQDSVGLSHGQEDTALAGHSEMCRGLEREVKQSGRWNF